MFTDSVVSACDSVAASSCGSVSAVSTLVALVALASAGSACSDSLSVVPVSATCAGTAVFTASANAVFTDSVVSACDSVAAASCGSVSAVSTLVALASAGPACSNSLSVVPVSATCAGATVSTASADAVFVDSSVAACDSAAADSCAGATVSATDLRVVFTASGDASVELDCTAISADATLLLCSSEVAAAVALALLSCATTSGCFSADKLTSTCCAAVTLS